MIQTNDETSCIWDALIVSISGPDDARINIGETATGITASAVYAYDNVSYDGTLTLNSTVFSYSSVGRHGYTVASASGDSYGITAIQTNDVTSCIWDALIVSISDPADQRINVGDTASGIVASAVYAFDGASYGGSLTLNSTTFTYNSVGKHGYTVSSAAGDDAYGIRAILTNDETYAIWDRILVRYYSVVDTRVNIGTTVHIDVALVLEYDNTSLTNGTVTINGIAATAQGSGVWRITQSSASVGSVTYNTVACSGGNYGIHVVNQHAQSVTVVWDSIEVYDLGAPSLVRVGATFPIWFHARLLYDGHTLGAGDTAVLAGITATWNGSYFVVETSISSEGSETFYVNSTTDATYGITSLSVSPMVTVDASEGSTVTNVVSDFTATNDLYEGVVATNPLWIVWDPVNDPTPPSFNFTINGRYLKNWTVTSSWSGLVVKSGTSEGTFTCMVEDIPATGLGNYTYTITVLDQTGLQDTYHVRVEVRDYTVPHVTGSADITYELGSTGHAISWDLSDANPDQYRVYVDGVAFNWTSWTNGIYNVSVDGLSIGSHNFTIEVSDTSSNLATDTVIITVVDTTAPTVSSPADIAYELGSSGHYITWTIDDFAPDSYRITTDGVAGTWKSLTSNTVKINVDGLWIGTHTYVIEVRDTSDNTNSDSVTVTVSDTTPPDVSHPDDINMTYGDTGRYISWNCSDLDPANYSISLDGSVIQTGTWQHTVNVTLDGLAVGNHTFVLVLADGSGNIVQDSVTVIVVPASTTTTTTTTTPPPTTTTTPGNITTSFTLPGGGGTIIIIIVIIATAGGIIIMVYVIIQKRAGP